MSTFTVAACPRAPVCPPRASSSRRVSGPSSRALSSHQAGTATGARGFGASSIATRSSRWTRLRDGRSDKNGRRSLSVCTASLAFGFADAVGFFADPSPGLLPAACANTLVFVAGIKTLLKGLTWPGVLNAWFLGTAACAAFGLGGYVLVCLYFVLGSAVTKLRLEQKQREGIAEARGGRRGVGSVWGSGVAGFVCALLALSGTAPVAQELWRLGFVASFCSKLSDTTASEVGKAYGKTTYMSTPPFKPVKRGTEGAVSLEGTLAGIGASVVFASAAACLRQVDFRGTAGRGFPKS
jgi:uncharacterized protein (TIGR00297 family)|tara:strand:- start:11864 stop:12751 length:888 start_codon:yes stop_codon:yes gene_type:complete